MRCEAVGAVAGAHPALRSCSGPIDWHEVLTRARGGSITDITNRLWACRRHHSWITDHDVEAVALGLARWSWQGPPT